MRKAGAIVAGIFLAVVAGWAQQKTALQGTITLRGGKKLTGKIQLAQLGVVDGSGIGAEFAQHGGFVLNVGGKTQRVAGDEIASVQVDWVNAGTEQEPRWDIKKITIVKKDGTKVEGAPDWLLHVTNAWVVTADGKSQKVYVFPFSGEAFSADDLIARIDLGEAAAAQPPKEAQPAPEKPAPEKPAPTKPAPEKPAQPKPPAVSAPAQPAKPPAAPAAPAQPAKPAGVAPAPTPPVAVGPMLGGDVMTFVIRCPKCGALIKVIISAQAVSLEHVSGTK